MKRVKHETIDISRDETPLQELRKCPTCGCGCGDGEERLQPVQERNGRLVWSSKLSRVVLGNILGQWQKVSELGRADIQKGSWEARVSGTSSKTPSTIGQTLLVESAPIADITTM